MSVREIVHTLFLFQAFVLVNGLLILCGEITGFKVKYIFVSHIVSIILHICFYYYCANYDAGVISGALHSTFEFQIILVSIYFFIAHFSLPDQMGFSMNNSFIDRLLPTNENNSHTFIILLQAYSMIIHSTFMVFIYNATFDYWAYAIILFVVLLQLIIVIMCLRIMYLYPTSADTPFYVSAYLMIIRVLIGSVYTNYHNYILYISAP